MSEESIQEVEQEYEPYNDNDTWQPISLGAEKFLDKLIENYGGDNE